MVCTRFVNEHTMEINYGHEIQKGDRLGKCHANSVVYAAVTGARCLLDHALLRFCKYITGRNITVDAKCNCSGN